VVKDLTVYRLSPTLSTMTLNAKAARVRSFSFRLLRVSWSWQIKSCFTDFFVLFFL